MSVSAGRALGDAWRTLWRDPRPMLGAAGLLFVAVAALNTFDLLLAPLDPPDLDKLAIYFAVAVPWSVVVLVPLMAGLDIMAIRQVRGQAVRTVDVAEGFRRGARAMAIYVTLSFFLTLGYLLFVVPGIILTLSLMLAPLYALDQDMGVRQSLRASMMATRRRMGAMFAFLAAAVGISLLGTALLVVGLVPAIAWLFLARAELYRQVRGEHALTAPPTDEVAPARPIPA